MTILSEDQPLQHEHGPEQCIDRPSRESKCFAAYPCGSEEPLDQRDGEEEAVEVASLVRAQPRPAMGVEERASRVSAPVLIHCVV
jgi:hypothetical protein